VRGSREAGRQAGRERREERGRRRQEKTPPPPPPPPPSPPLILSPATINWLANPRIVIPVSLQHTATHCNTMKTHCERKRVLSHTDRDRGNTNTQPCCQDLQERKTPGIRSLTATHCNTLQHVNTPQHTATHCNTLQHADTLQHTATHCNTLP